MHHPGTSCCVLFVRLFSVCASLVEDVDEILQDAPDRLRHVGRQQTLDDPIRVPGRRKTT